MITNCRTPAISTAVFQSHHGKHQAPLGYERAQSAAISSRLSTANFKSQGTLKYVVCFELLSYLYCKDKMVQWAETQRPHNQQ